MTNGPASTEPKVSIIVPVWNVEPYIRQCLDSVLGQTIGPDRLELIAVDDGSTDGSGAILDEYAARHPQVRVLHERNSGGPGRPRNVGLDQASLTYVFFLDGDDYLGREALERLIAMAERNRSDIVLGKIVGVDGRHVYRRTGAFRRTEDRVDVERVFRLLNVQKLFRRSLFNRANVRFKEGQATGEDAEMMTRLYLDARVISVVADYDCYYLRRREGSQSRRRDMPYDLVEWITRLEDERISVVAARRRAGLGRDMLVSTHLRRLLRKFDARWRAQPPDERRRAFEAGAAVLERWHSRRIQRELPAWLAIRAYCLQHALLTELEDIAASSLERAVHDPIVERGRIYARIPHLRDASRIPDSCFDITREVIAQQTLAQAAIVRGSLELSGEAYLILLGGNTSVELRGWPRGPRWRFETTPIATPLLRDTSVAYPMAGYATSIDLATAAGGQALPRGSWSVRVSIGTDAVRRNIPIRLHHDAGRSNAGPGPVLTGAGLRFSAAGELRLRIGRPRPVELWLERAETASARLSAVGRRALSLSRPGRLALLALERLRR